MFFQKNILKNKFFIAGGCFIFLIVILLFLSRGKVYEKKDLSYGATFSPQQATDLGLDWRKVYLAMLNDLGVKKIRLAAYWNKIEATENSYDWADLDWQIDTAGNAQAKIILAVGGRLPRWPECHYPGWTKSIDEKAKEEKILNYIQATVERYKNNSQIIAWQVENEPFLSNFGECPDLNVSLLDKEISLVRSLDSRPIVVTDSGELSIWVPAAKRADIFGTTMYLNTYSQHLKSYIRYPITPSFFKLKKNLTSLFAKPKDWLVIELQAEPWCPVPFQNASQADRDRTMSEQKFKNIIEFARLTGFREFYLWGVEWWYWEKETQNNPVLWNYAKTLYNNN